MSHRTRIALALVWALTAWLPAAAQQARTKIVLDTDIGTDIDDAWAVGYALKSPSFELLGVTVTDADTPRRARLACKLLHRLGRTDVPVAAGRQTPAVPPDRVDYQFTWAEDFQAYKPVGTPAVEFLAETIRRNPGQVTLIAVGPLQNIGDLVRLHPDVVPLVKRVVLMSGSIGPNAWSSTAVPEWNVKVAIPEAQAVYAAAWPMTIVPLDSTTYVRLEDQERETLRKAGTPLVVALEALLRLWMDRPSSRMTLHDQMALAEAQHPGRFFGRCEPMPLRVDREGYTRVDKTGGRQVTVCLEPKRNEFMSHFLAQLAGNKRPGAPVRSSERSCVRQAVSNWDERDACTGRTCPAVRGAMRSTLPAGFARLRGPPVAGPFSHFFPSSLRYRSLAAPMQWIKPRTFGRPRAR